jgi:protocatechuate 4,5-dioxygenase beta chain
VSRIVSMFGVSHHPGLARMRHPEPGDPALAGADHEFQALQDALAASRPDVLVCIGNDHLNQFFMENMPQFLVGKSPTAKGTWPWEREWGAPDYEAVVDVDLARHIVRRGPERGVDFAFSDEFLIDHAFTMPLAFLRPQGDLPIVPVFCNVMAPPIPPARRFYDVGGVLRSLVQDFPGDQRVAVVCSGHLSVEVGGSRPLAPDEEFDRWASALVGDGEVEQALDKLSYERLKEAGNYAAGFLTFVLLAGMAGGAPCTSWQLLDTPRGRLPFFQWSFA